MRNDDNFKAAVDALTQARGKGIKWPKIRLQTRGGGPNNEPVKKIVLSLAGPKARSQGSVNITNGRRHGEPGQEWYGRIYADGKYGMYRRECDWVTQLIRVFCRDPQGTARIMGALSGSCCFCGRDLETRESVGAGYGPICAGKYGLPWGDVDRYEERKDRVIDDALAGGEWNERENQGQDNYAVARG